MPKSQHPSHGSRTSGGFRFQEVVQQLRLQIQSGQLAPGDRLPRFAELQVHFHTSPGTVNRALITLEQEGLILRQPRRGMFVADKQAIVQKHAIGLAAFDFQTIGSSYYIHLLQSIQAVAHEADNEVVLMKPETTRGLERVDGLLFHGANLRQMPAIAPLMPVVTIMDSVPGVAGVLADDFGGAKAATTHLMELGHRNIAFLTFERAPINQRRLAGYRSALLDADIKPNEGWVRDLEAEFLPTLRECGYSQMKKWLQQDWQRLGCTAIICQNDSAAVGVLQAIQDAGLNVPAHISVVGFDDTEEAVLTSPKLTTVQVPLRQVGQLATQMLLKNIRTESQEELTITLPTHLVVRSSTAAPPQSA